MTLSYCELQGAPVTVVRLDQVDDSQSGNKFFKLKYNLQHVKLEGYERVISFGGAYSNHIHALALAGRESGIDTVGIIRGEERYPLNPTLADAVTAGMRLRYISRQRYREKQAPDFLQQLQEEFPNSYILPEGGSNLLGVRGCLDIKKYINQEAGLVLLPCGTGATLAGVAASLPECQVVGISVLKNALDLEERVAEYLSELLREGYIQHIPQNWAIRHEFHCGGYAKVNTGLAGFIDQFFSDTGIPVEPVYTGKMFYALEQMLQQGEIEATTPVTAIHTGGLQGLRGMESNIAVRI